MSPAELLEGLGFGAFIGLALGALGAGGLILTVSILVYAMGVPVQTATGTSLSIVGLAVMWTPRSARRRKAVCRRSPRTAVFVDGCGPGATNHLPSPDHTCDHVDFPGTSAAVT